MQEQGHHDHHRQHRQRQRDADLFNRGGHKGGGVEFHLVDQVVREARREAFQLRAHRVGHAQGVGGRRRVDAEVGGIVPVQLRAGAVAARAELDGGDVLQAHQLAHLARADDDVGKVFGLA